MSTLPINVIIVDNRPVIRRGLKETLLEEHGIILTAELDNMQEAIEYSAPSGTVYIVKAQPNTREFAQNTDLLIQKNSARLIALSDHADALAVGASLRAGVAGHITLDTLPAEIINTVRRVAVGMTHVAGIPRRDEQLSTKDAALSKRELEVLALIAAGHTASEIASFLQISVKTVDTYKSRIAGKTGLRTRAELVQFALSRGIMK